MIWCSLLIWLSEFDAMIMLRLQIRSPRMFAIRRLALVQFDRLMEKRLVTPFFQPIVTIDGTTNLGYEVLARSRMFGLETSAAPLGAATKLNLETELSQMLRWEGIREGMTLPGNSRVYVNTHPLELGKPGLIESMAQVRDDDLRFTDYA